MKTFILTMAACLIMTSEFAQSTAPKMYYISEVDGKIVVMLNNKVITSTVYIDTLTQLLANGIVIWGDKSTTFLRPGDCIDDSGFVYSERNETDFIGNPHALNHIHMLPLVTVTGEAETTNSEVRIYTEYMERIYKQIEKNDYEISLIKEKLWTKSRKDATKYRKKLHSLERENVDLKIDFDTFVHFGPLSEWKSFRAEMNADIKPLVQDISSMKSELF